MDTQKMSPKQKSYVLFNEVGNKLNRNKDLQYLFVNQITPVKNLCHEILLGCDTGIAEYKFNHSHFFKQQNMKVKMNRSSLQHSK